MSINYLFPYVCKNNMSVKLEDSNYDEKNILDLDYSMVYHVSSCSLEYVKNGSDVRDVRFIFNSAPITNDTKVSYPVSFKPSTTNLSLPGEKEIDMKTYIKRIVANEWFKNFKVVDSIIDSTISIDRMKTFLNALLTNNADIKTSDGASLFNENQLKSFQAALVILAEQMIEAHPELIESVIILPTDTNPNPEQNKFKISLPKDEQIYSIVSLTCDAFTVTNNNSITGDDTTVNVFKKDVTQTTKNFDTFTKTIGVIIKINSDPIILPEVITSSSNLLELFPDYLTYKNGLKASDKLIENINETTLLTSEFRLLEESFVTNKFTIPDSIKDLNKDLKRMSLILAFEYESWLNHRNKMPNLKNELNSIINEISLLREKYGWDGMSAPVDGDPNYTEISQLYNNYINLQQQLMSLINQVAISFTLNGKQYTFWKSEFSFSLTDTYNLMKLNIKSNVVLIRIDFNINDVIINDGTSNNEIKISFDEGRFADIDVDSFPKIAAVVDHVNRVDDKDVKFYFPLFDIILS